MAPASILLYLGVAAACGLAAVSWRRPSPSAAPSDCPPVWAAAALMGAFALRLAIVSLVEANGFILTTMDEPARWQLALDWAERPFLFSWDGIWLTGNFAFFGAPVRWGLPLLMALQIGVLIQHAVTLGGMFYLTWILSGRRWPAAAAALAVAVAFPLLWMGRGPLADPMVGGAMLFGAGWVIRWRRLCASGANRALGYACAAGVAAFVATSMHFTGWMAVAVAAPFVLGAALTAPPEGRRAARFGLLVIGFGSALFPFLWFTGSWGCYGDPFEFLRVQAEANQFYLPDQTLLPPRWAIYPWELACQWWMMAPLVLSGGAMALAGRLGAPARWLGVYGLALLGLMALSAVMGGYSAGWYRSVIVLNLIGMALAAASLRSLGGWAAGVCWRRVSVAMAALVLAGTWCVFNVANANRAEMMTTQGLSHRWVAVGTWLGLEARHPAMLPPFRPDGRAVAYCEPGAQSILPYLNYTAGLPAPIDREEHLWGDPERYDYFFTPETPRVPGWDPTLTEVGGWAAWRSIHLRGWSPSDSSGG